MLEANKVNYAMKISLLTGQEGSYRPLEQEAKTLFDLKNAPVPLIQEYSTWTYQQKDYEYLVMHLKGSSLHDLQKREKGGVFSEISVLQTVVYLIRVFKIVHSKGYIYKDVKPQNFTQGLTEMSKNFLFLIDLGLASKYIEDGIHITEHDSQVIGGTPQFMSVNCH